MEKTGHKANRLLQETSPYLRQHAYNPVDWYPWGEEALSAARKDNRPIFLSVGYSACHWCHVMERESFENEAIAALMNENFINIKVDREERPDLDHIYMNVVQLMTGRGGWPMSVFLTPEQQPIFGGTYFPPVEHHGMPSFPRVLQEVARIYREQPKELTEQMKHLSAALKKLSNLDGEKQTITESPLAEAADDMLSEIDPRFGGFGGAPKFPQPLALDFLLRVFQRNKKPALRQAIDLTLRRMAEGGIYDHLGGGFARYSVDERWAVPHFEKMLYDNALLARIYFAYGQASGEPFFRAVGEDVLRYVQRRMTAPEGGFFSSEDADSEGEEGKFYAWDPREMKAVLGDADGELLGHYFGVDEAGNFEHGKTVLAIHRTVKQLAERFHQPEAEIRLRLESGKKKLFDAREKRIPPGKDDKILTSWNALMIRAFVKGYEATGDSSFRESAERAAGFILRTLTDPAKKSRLLATAKGDRAKLPAYLDDYAFFVAALLDLFEMSGEASWLTHAREFHAAMVEHFCDRKDFGFFFTADDHEALIDRPKTFYDGAIPSGNSVALENLARFAVLEGEGEGQRLLEKNLERHFSSAVKRPLGMANLLVVADRVLGPQVEIVLVPGAGGNELENVLRGVYLPRAMILRLDEKAAAGAGLRGLNEILSGKTAKSGRATLYVCQGNTCSAPIETAKDLQAELSRGV